jgi:SAM-dependent methyltransferase
MGRTLSRYGDVVGIEASSIALSVGDYAAYSEVVQAGDVSDPAFPAGQFDLIALLDVLEHVEDDSALLVELAARLAPGGSLLVSVPMWPELYGEGDRMAGHFRRYTPESLLEAVREAGLELRLSTGYVVALLPIARIQRRRVARGKASATDELEVLSRPINGMATLVSVVEGWISGTVGLPPGLSVFALLERSSDASRGA